ncbi:hypothetical protein SLE2022_183250 [Rubroshorea leprosula]
MLRIYQPVPEVLDALRSSRMSVAVGPKNEELQNLAASPDAAAAIAPYRNDVQFKWITLRNEFMPGPLATYVAPAMNNVRNALMSIGLNVVKVTTVLPSNPLSASYLPSAGTFDSSITGIMSDIASILVQDGAPLMLNLYPYFPYSSDPDHISLAYALFRATSPPVVDGRLNYFNLFDAMVDSFNAALEKINYGAVVLAISESGWPTTGNAPFASIENSQTCNKNLLEHVPTNGTPRRPSVLMDTFFFEMFNENLKESGVEQNFGFFYSNMEPVYPFW